MASSSNRSDSMRPVGQALRGHEPVVADAFGLQPETLSSEVRLHRGFDGDQAVGGRAGAPGVSAWSFRLRYPPEKHRCVVDVVRVVVVVDGPVAAGCRTAWASRCCSRVSICPTRRCRSTTSKPPTTHTYMAPMITVATTATRAAWATYGRRQSGGPSCRHDPVAEGPDGFDLGSAGGDLGPSRARWTSSVFDPRASASSFQTASAIDRRDTTAGERCIRISSSASSVAVRRVGRTDAHLSGDRVEGQVGHLDDDGLHGLSAALQRPHTGQKLREVERLDQVVVRSLVEAGHPVTGRVACVTSGWAGPTPDDAVAG